MEAYRASLEKLSLEELHKKMTDARIRLSDDRELCITALIMNVEHVLLTSRE